MRKVLAFVGTEGSGKTFSCQRLLMTKGFKKVSFANSLRDIAYLTLDIKDRTPEQYDKLKTKNCIAVQDSWDENDEVGPLRPDNSSTGHYLNFRNILENLGSAVRKYDEDFWAKSVLKYIEETPQNICIDDLRYPNEYRVLNSYCKKNQIDFKVVFTDYHSERYRDDNPHESAGLANYLKKQGYKDQEYVDEIDILNYELMQQAEKSMILFKEDLEK